MSYIMFVCLHLCECLSEAILTKEGIYKAHHSAGADAGGTVKPIKK